MAAGVFAILMVRSARNTRAEPFTIERQDLTGWVLTLTPDADRLGSLLAITGRSGALPPLSRELFARTGESSHYPPAVMPLALHREFKRAMAGAHAGGAAHCRARGRSRVAKLCRNRWKPDCGRPSRFRRQQ